MSGDINTIQTSGPTWYTMRCPACGLYYQYGTLHICLPNTQWFYTNESIRARIERLEQELAALKREVG